MSARPNSLVSDGDAGFFQRLRSTFASAVFAAVHRSPKLLEFYRSQRSWTLFRVALGVFGAGLVVLPLGFWSGWIAGVIGPLLGLALFVASILMPDPSAESQTDHKAKELGAATVVGGGEYQPGNGAPAEAQLFVSPEHVWALDKTLNPLVVIEVGEISRIRVDHYDDVSILRIQWADHKAEFCYRGVFAERFARLAAEAIHAVVPRDGKTATKGRAASV